MGLCKDFWPVLPFPTHSSSLQRVLQRDCLAPCSCSCLCSGTRIQPCRWLFSPMNPRICGQPVPSSSDEGDTGPVLTEPRLCWGLFQSHTCWSKLIQSLGWGELPTARRWGKDSCPKLAAWSAKKCCPTQCPAAWGARQLQEALWCQQLHLQANREWKSVSFCSFLLFHPPHPSSHSELCFTALLITKWSHHKNLGQK